MSGENNIKIKPLKENIIQAPILVNLIKAVADV